MSFQLTLEEQLDIKRIKDSVFNSLRNYDDMKRAQTWASVILLNIIERFLVCQQFERNDIGWENIAPI